MEVVLFKYIIPNTIPSRHPCPGYRGRARGKGEVARQTETVPIAPPRLDQAHIRKGKRIVPRRTIRIRGNAREGFAGAAGEWGSAGMGVLKTLLKVSGRPLVWRPTNGQIPAS